MLGRAAVDGKIGVGVVAGRGDVDPHAAWERQAASLARRYSESDRDSGTQGVVCNAAARHGKDFAMKVLALILGLALEFEVLFRGVERLRLRRHVLRPD